MFSENNYGIIHLIGDDSKVDTPLPIPNREVKHFNGENSSLSEYSKKICQITSTAKIFFHNIKKAIHKWTAFLLIFRGYFCILAGSVLTL